MKINENQWFSWIFIGFHWFFIGFHRFFNGFQWFLQWWAGSWGERAPVHADSCRENSCRKDSGGDDAGRRASFREDSWRGDSRKSASAPVQRESQPSNPFAIVIVDLIIYMYIYTYIIISHIYSSSLFYACQPKALNANPSRRLLPNESSPK